MPKVYSLNSYLYYNLTKVISVRVGNTTTYYTVKIRVNLRKLCVNWTRKNVTGDRPVKRKNVRLKVVR